MFCKAVWSCPALSCRLSGGVRRGVRRVQHDAPGAVGRLESDELAAVQALAHGLGGQAEDAGGGDQVDAVLLLVWHRPAPVLLALAVR